MPILLDTNILLRLANAADPQQAITRQALQYWYERGKTLHITPQNMIEFRNGATRPAANNGLGWTSAEAAQESAQFEQTFALLLDIPAIYPAWKAVVSAVGVIGKQVHDARLAAVCHVYGLDSILTFNPTHFLPFTAFSPGLIVLDPRDFSIAGRANDTLG